mmetsp:Transcript_19678/g.62581  ORF Transcript_19678/g.62581 Transcript_19678/m.62581 type:complete len:203 (+) Transcript_19678:68-676(+)
MKYGDICAFRLVLNNGMGATYLTASERNTPQVRLEQLGEGVRTAPDPPSCHFQVVQRFQYTAQQLFKDELRGRGIGMDQWRAALEIQQRTAMEDSARGRYQDARHWDSGIEDARFAAEDPRLQVLDAQASDELTLNEDEFERYIGDRVLYGHVIQLRHVASGKFLTIQRESADVDKSALRVSLDPVGGQDSWLRINKVHWRY